MNYPEIRHGSHNSLDEDYHIIIPEIMDRKSAKQLCDSHHSGSANAIVVEDGQVVWTYKGTPDEANNGILATYDLHEQVYANPVKELVPRDVAVKVVRTVRGLLGVLSRTQYRAGVKEALRNPDMVYKLKVLESIDLTEVVEFGKRDLVDARKFIAFQIGQTLAMIDAVELYTKDSVGEFFPNLKPYLQREIADHRVLNRRWQEFITCVKAKCHFNDDMVFMKQNPMDAADTVSESRVVVNMFCGEPEKFIWTETDKERFNAFMNEQFKVE